MIFDIKLDQKPLVKDILGAVEMRHPRTIGMGDIALYVDIKRHVASAHHLRFVTAQLIAMGFIKPVGESLSLTFEGADLLRKLGV